jgi:hypothetical protein
MGYIQHIVVDPIIPFGAITISIQIETGDPVATNITAIFRRIVTPNISISFNLKTQAYQCNKEYKSHFANIFHTCLTIS